MRIILFLILSACTAFGTIGDNETTLTRKANRTPRRTTEDGVLILTYQADDTVLTAMFLKGRSVAECAYTIDDQPISSELINEMLLSYAPKEEWVVTDMGLDKTVCLCSHKAQVCIAYGALLKGYKHVMMILGRKWLDYTIK